MAKISNELQLRIAPKQLIKKYGNTLAIAVYEVLQVVDQNDESILLVLDTLDCQPNEDLRFSFVRKLWDRHYQCIAEKVITGRDMR